MAIEQRAYRQRAAALYALALLRFALLGFSYQPLLDDHIQYYNYANLMGALPQAVSRLGLLAARPLAGLADIAVWSRFWPCLFLALALLAALLTLSALLFERLFDEMVGTGPLFTWFFLLLPANFEATYWLSASTRVIPGLLLAACAGLCALRAEKRPWLMLAAGGCCLLAAGFYEQCFVLAAGLCALCGLFWTRRPLTKVASVVLPCAAYGVYATLCAAAGPSALYGARASLVLPFRDAAFFSQHLPQVFEQLYAVFKSIPALTLRALLRFPGVLAQTLWPALPMLLALLALLWWTTLHLDKRFSTGAREECVSSRFARPEASDKARQERALGPKEQSCTSLPADISPKKRAWLALLIGALVAIGPFAPFFVIANPWIGLRALGAALPGLALFADALLRIAPLSPKGARLTAGAIASALLLATLPELADYRLTAAQDAALLEAVADALPQNAKAVALLGVQPCYLPDQNYEWHEHLHGVTESRWALTGALRQTCDSLDIPTVTPLAQGSVYGEYADPAQYDAFLLVRGGGACSAQDITVTPLVRNGAQFLDQSGAVCAILEGTALTIY